MGLTGSNSKIKKKFEPPRKALRDCNTVNHALVPRKLRSAMKKRGRESVSPPLPDEKNPNHAMDKVRSAGGEGETKLRVNQKDDLGNDPITKDEEEAVETLFALAEMFQNSNKMTGAKSPLLAPENEETAQETLQVKCSIIQSGSLTAQPVHSKPSCVSISYNFESEPSMITNFRQLVHEEVVASERRSEIAAAGAAVGGLHERHFTTENGKIIGLWPGSSSAVPLRADTKGSPIYSPGAYNSESMSSSKNVTLIDEVSRDPTVRNKSRKRCIAHVHIGHLIKGLQADEKAKNNAMQPLNQLTEIEIPKQEAPLDKSVLKIGITSSDAEKDQNEIRNAVLLHKRLLQESQQPSSTPTLYTTSKHNFDFLSLSTGGGAAEATKTAIKTGNLIEPWTQFHPPYLHSVSQNHTNVPFSHPQSHYSNAPFTDYFPILAAKQVQIKMQSYASNPILAPAQLGNASSPGQHQQRISASQFTSQYKPMGFSSPHNNPTMQNRKLDPPTSVPFAQSLELLHPTYIPMLPHQGHNLIPLTSSLPNCRAKTPYHHPLPSGYNW